MNKMIEDDEFVEILGRSRALLVDEIRAKTLEFSQTNLKYLEVSRKDNYLQIGRYRIDPNGFDNNFPSNFKTLLDSVYIGHGVKRSLINLILSGGVGIYKEVKEGREIVKDWLIDDEISDWLDSFNFHTEYLQEAATDMIYVENNYPLLLRNVGARFGRKPFFAGLKLLSAMDCRLEYSEIESNRRFIYNADWQYSLLDESEIVEYPLIDQYNAFKNPVSAMFIKMATFGSRGYGRPPEIGATEMLQTLSLLPRFHRAVLTEKGFKWIVSVNQKYYQAIRDENKWAPNSKEFIAWKTDFKRRIDEFLLAPDAGKIQTRLMTEFSLGVDGKPIDAIRITKLEDDTKELTEAGLSLSDTYTMGLVSASGLNPQLANVHLKNHALSGSNFSEAYNMHILTNTPTIRNLILYPVNFAIRQNWPDKRVKLGFYETQLEGTKTPISKKNENTVQQKQ